MGILEMIAEWRKGCSCAGPAYDGMVGNPAGTTSPEDCPACTLGLVEAIERKLGGAPRLIEMLHAVTLVKGRALVIAGPLGCGKSTLARQIAVAYGVFNEVRADAFDGLSRVLRGNPKTVIVDGLPSCDLEALIASETICVETLGGAPKDVPTPNFIFCTGEADALKLSGRRFHVFFMGVA